MKTLRKESISVEQLSDVILKSLENEEVLDLHVAQRYFSEAELEGLPGFKQFKLVPLRRKYGEVIVVAIKIFAFLVPAKFFFEMFVWLLLRLLTPKRKAIVEDCVYFCCFEPYVALLDQVLSKQEGIKLTGLRCIDIVQHLPISVILDGVRAGYLVYRRIRTMPSGQRTSLTLISWDLYKLTLIALFAIRFPSIPIATSSVLQRWAFVSGHLGQKVWMVQHGAQAVGIPFKHKFSDVDRIYAYSEKQFENYKYYYSTKDWRLISNNIEITDFDRSSSALFLASSAPFVDEEIAILRALKSDITVPIAVKLHPRHDYGKNSDVLLDMADIVVPATVNPDCRVFISHSSFYGLLYERLGITTISFSECKDFEAVRSLLEAEGIMSPRTDST